MEILIIILSGILVAAGVYLILSKSLLRIIIGSSIISHAVNLLLLTSGTLKMQPHQSLPVGTNNMSIQYRRHSY